MSSLNPHYTFQYSQPDAYHYSHDSVFLARALFELEGRELQGKAALDLCAGCGIVGLDFLFHCQKELGTTPERCDFIEVQKAYQEHFAHNLKHLPTLNGRFLLQNYRTLVLPESHEAYDLILCNPPYFRLEQGTLSPSEFKNRCRFFIDSDFPTLLKGIENALKISGRAYLLVPDLVDHGIQSLAEARAIFSPQIVLETVTKIRGTPLLRATKLRTSHA